MAKASARGWAALGALVWLAIAAVRVSVVPFDLWRWRDDGVITLSHAYGWVVNGVPSVSASGDRIEGFSAPLEFFVGSIYYALGGRGWETLLDLQVVVGALATGYFVARFLQHLLPEHARTPTLLAGVAASAVVGLLPWASSGWLVSGMENSLTLPLLAAAMAAFAGVDRQRGWALGVAIGLAGVSRTEFAALLLPALGVVVLLAVARKIPAAVAARVVGITGVVWALVHGWRWHTFGSLIPNTAVVQDKMRIAALSPGLLLLPVLAPLAVAALRRWPRLRALLTPAAAALLLASLALPRLVDLSDSELGPATVLTVAELLVGVTLAFVGSGRMLAWAGCLLVGSTPIMQFAIFGSARLDSLRIFAMALPLLAATTGGLVIVLATRAQQVRAHAHRLAALAGIAASTAGGVSAIHAAHTRDLCCGVDSYAVLLETAERLRVEADLPRVIVANPDLGKVSFAKDVVVTDLGRLGDGLMTQIAARHPTKMADLLDRVLGPDVVQVHDSWNCRFQPWLQSAAFADQFVLSYSDGTQPEPSCLAGGAYLIFTRRLDAPGFADEARLAKRLAAAPEIAPARIVIELEACAAASDDPLRCQWIRRAVRRAAPELRGHGAYDAAVDAFAASPTPELDRLLLTTPPGWSERAATLLAPLLVDS